MDASTAWARSAAHWSRDAARRIAEGSVAGFAADAGAEDWLEDDVDDDADDDADEDPAFARVAEVAWLSGALVDVGLLGTRGGSACATARGFASAEVASRDSVGEAAFGSLFLAVVASEDASTGGAPSIERDLELNWARAVAGSILGAHAANTLSVSEPASAAGVFQAERGTRRDPVGPCGTS
jgi:hypothetical protein